MVLSGGVIEWVGPAAHAPRRGRPPGPRGRAVIPGFVDSHTHLVFAGDRSAEFAARMTGTPYDGGGIAVSVAATRAATDDELRTLVGVPRRRDAGPGHDDGRDQERLRAHPRGRAPVPADRAQVHTPTTFLGAHVVPPKYRTAGRATSTSSPDPCSTPSSPVGWKQAQRHTSTCSASPTRSTRLTGTRRTILTAGRERGFAYASTATNSAMVPGCSSPASSARRASTTARTSPTVTSRRSRRPAAPRRRLLPGVEFSTRSPYPDARRLIDAGVDVAPASDCNPGTCYSSSIPFAIALAVREMGMTPAERCTPRRPRRAGRSGWTGVSLSASPPSSGGQRSEPPAPVVPRRRPTRAGLRA